MNETESQIAALGVYLDRDLTPVDTFRGRQAIFRAQPGAYLESLKQFGTIDCDQTERAAALALERLGFPVVPGLEGSFSQIIVFATKHREEVLHHLALATRFLREGGRLLVVAANGLGAPSLERRLTELLGRADAFSKHKCRVLIAIKEPARINESLRAQWEEAGTLRNVIGGAFFSAPGMFSWKAIDPGSRLLAAHLPSTLKGHGADLGAGYGVLSHALLSRCQGLEALTLIESEGKALEAARINLESQSHPAALDFIWADVTQGIPLKELDFVVTNPPFHAGKGALPSLGRCFIREAFSALKIGGRLWFVANRHLPYEGEIEGNGLIQTVIEADGFKVIEAIKVKGK